LEQIKNGKTQDAAVYLYVQRINAMINDTEVEDKRKNIIFSVGAISWDEIDTYRAVLKEKQEIEARLINAKHAQWKLQFGESCDFTEIAKDNDSYRFCFTVHKTPFIVIIIDCFTPAELFVMRDKQVVPITELSKGINQIINLIYTDYKNIYNNYY